MNMLHWILTNNLIAVISTYICLVHYQKFDIKIQQKNERLFLVLITCVALFPHG